MNIENVSALDDLLNTMDDPAKAPPQETTEPAPAEVEEKETEVVEETAEAESTESESKEEEQEKVNPEDYFFDNRKQNQAFAAMRVENKELKGVYERLRTIMGVDPNLSPSEQMQAVNAGLIAAEAQARELPEDVLTQSYQNEERLSKAEEELLRTHADLGFQKVMDTYKLKPDDLRAFAQQLSEAGKNPYANSMDLLQEYRLLNFDTLIEKAKSAGIKEERARASKVAASSTQPSEAVGAPESAPESISTVAGLNRLLEKRK